MKMKRMNKLLACLMAAILMMASTSALTAIAAHAEESDIENRIWQAMGEAGGMDMSKAWSFKGIYSFGETTDQGELDMISDEDNPGTIKGQITFHYFPKGFSEVTGKFLDMLTALLNEAIDGGMTEREAKHLGDIVEAISLGVLNGKAFDFSEKGQNIIIPIGKVGIAFQYEPTYRELIARLTLSDDYEYWHR